MLLGFGHQAIHRIPADHYHAMRADHLARPSPPIVALGSVRSP